MANPIAGFDPRHTHYELSPASSIASGNTLVLVHGVGLDHRMWDWQITPLASQFSVLRYDLLGHGQTPVDPTASTLADFVVQLKTLLDFLQIEHVHLVGFSLGALIAQLFAREHADYLASVTFMNGVYRRVEAELDSVRHRLALTREHGASSTVDLAIERWFTEPYRSQHPDIMERVRQRLLANNLDGYVTAYSCFVHGDPEVGDALTQVKCPALAITGEDDVGSTPQMCHRMAADLDDATVKILPGLRHGAPIEGAAVMSRALLKFLAGVEKRLEGRS